MRRRPTRKYARGGHIKEYAAAQYSTTSQLLSASNSLVYSFRSFGLNAASERIQNIARSYQEYRIKKITWQCRPLYDTFPAPGSATAPSVPHLYWRVDKLGSFNNDTTLQTLKASGCKPIRLDDKMIVKSFKPVVLTPVAVGASDADGDPVIKLGGYRTSPWLATNDNAYQTGSGSGLEWEPSTVDHLGLLLAIDADIVPFSSSATVSFTVEFEFRKPLDDIDPNGETVLEVVDISNLQPKAPPKEVVV